MVLVFGKEQSTATTPSIEAATLTDYGVAELRADRRTHFPLSTEVGCGVGAEGSKSSNWWQSCTHVATQDSMYRGSCHTLRGRALLVWPRRSRVCLDDVCAGETVVSCHVVEDPRRIVRRMGRLKCRSHLIIAIVDCNADEVEILLDCTLLTACLLTDCPQ